jgi:hypothetical protein
MGVLIVVALTWWRVSSPKPPNVAPAARIDKQRAAYEMHTFDPAAPPANMPPLSGMEAAATDSNFISNANVKAKSQRVDATHATVTVTAVKVQLKLNIDVWVPTGASQRVIDHEQGHREIAEYYYRDADKLAERISTGYIGKQFAVSGVDLDAEVQKLLQKLSGEITAEYNDQLNPDVAQQRYDDITDHSRNDIAAHDAVARVLREI